MAVLAVLAAIGAVLAGGRPSGWVVTDVVLSMVFAAAVVWFASVARRWTWFILAGLAGAMSAALIPIVLSLVTLALAYASAFAPRRMRLVGALIGLVSIQILLRLPDQLPTLVTVAGVTVAVVPCLWSGYKLHPRRARRGIRIVAEAVGVLAGLVLVIFGLAAASSRNAIDQGRAQAEAALDAARVGDQAEAVRRFELALTTFERGRSRMDAWWAQPARALPLVGVQADTMSAVMSSGTEVTRQALRTAEVADYQELRTDGGQVDLSLVRAFQDPVRRLTAVVTESQAELAEMRSPLLFPPLADQIEDFELALGQAREEAVLASEVLEVAPRLLGADGPRRYALLFGTPAELRELGGYVGNIGELTAVDGKLTLENTQRSTDFNPATTEELESRTLADADDLPTRYQAYQLTRFLGNVSGTQDFPTVARTFGQVYPEVGRAPVDGVIYVDPYGLAGLLRLTGPIEVEGVPVPLTADNAAGFLLRSQYTTFQDFEERVDFLDAAAEETFRALTSRTLPGPRTLADTLSPLVRSRRIMAFSFHPEDLVVLERMGLTGGVPALDGSDYLSVTNANANPNKIDAYLERDVSYRVRFGPESGAVESTVTVTLRNTAPGAGLPDYTISNQADLPAGTNRSFLSVYSPLSFSAARRDGEPVSPEPQREQDRNRYSFFLEIPPGATLTLELDLAGEVAPGSVYALTYLDQPAVNPGRWEARVEGMASAPAAPPTLEGPAFQPRLSVVEGAAVAEATVAGGVVELRVPF